ncbi:MAG: carbohydrate kinase family protein [Candidatus Kerfeldbacteria bacterium]|nr:carbohydrate kinase family protein [Candidatus Kerfeldbacteria bacterium]
MKKFDVITIGSALRDVMFYTDQACVMNNPAKDPARSQLICVEYGAKIRSENVHFEFGGGAANTAVNFAGLGLRTAVVTAIGDDFDGQSIERQLQTAGVDIRYLQKTSKHQTGFSFLTIDEKTGDHVAYVYYGAVQDLQLTSTQYAQLQTKWLYLGSLNTPKWKQILRTIFSDKHEQSQIAWNPGATQISAGFRTLKPYIRETDILILNRDEAIELLLTSPQSYGAHSMEEMVEYIHGFGPRIVLLTNGRGGSYAYDGKQHYHLNTPQDHPKDTTGAGDCYGSSFVAGMIRYKGDIQKSMRLATLNASHLVQQIGAQNGLLKWNDLPKRLQE